MVMLALSFMRVNVVLALFVGAMAGGLSGGLDLGSTMEAFTRGLGGGHHHRTELCHAGRFRRCDFSLRFTSMGSGFPSFPKSRMNPMRTAKAFCVYGIFAVVLMMAVFSQNLVPVHIAFIPISDFRLCWQPSVL